MSDFGSWRYRHISTMRFEERHLKSYTELATNLLKPGGFPLKDFSNIANRRNRGTMAAVFSVE